MKTLFEIASELDTDKTQSRGYIENFELHFGPLRQDPIRILELGVYHGGSLLMWHSYFPQALVVGLDRRVNPFPEMPERIRFYQGSQDDEELLDRVAEECAPEGFDIIIDDASHVGTFSRASFRNLFHKHLKPGGLYIVEDWGTGYWKSWPDGAAYASASNKPAGRFPRERLLLRRLAKRLPLIGSLLVPATAVDSNFASHNFGMVGFVKELVDEVAWQDIAHPQHGNRQLPVRKSMIRQMTIYPGHVFLIKA